MYNIEFTKQAIKDLHQIPKNYASLIINKIKQLAVNPYNTVLDIKRFKNMEIAYRLRVGNYRVI